MRTSIGNSNIRGKKIIKKISKPKLRKGGSGNGEDNAPTVQGSRTKQAVLKPLPLTDIQKKKIIELNEEIKGDIDEIEKARKYIKEQDESRDITETRYYYHFLIELINILDNALENNGKIIFANEDEYYYFKQRIFNNYHDEIMLIYRDIRGVEGPLVGIFVARAEIYYEKINSDVKSFFDDNPDKKYDYIKSFLVNNNYNNDKRLDIFIEIINKIIQYLHKEVMYHQKIIVNRQQQTSHDGGASKVVVKKALNPYNKYVAKQFPSMKKKFPNEKASEIMKKIAIEWNKTKA